jgi:hypothetical protein
MSKHIFPNLKSFRHRLLLPVALGLAFTAACVLHAAALSPGDQQFLSGYVKVHDALIANDLTGVIKAADMLPEGSGAGLAQAGSLTTARDEFAKLAPRAEKLAAGQSGYHVFYCPMVKKDWVQTGTAIANPYLGADMLGCGVEKK